MPEMNDPELAKRILFLHPKIRRLFTSGYTGSIIANQGVLEENIDFIPKPFSMWVLAAKVRGVLAVHEKSYRRILAYPCFDGTVGHGIRRLLNEPRHGSLL